MSVGAILDVARSGMDHERLRMDAAGRNIAGANVPIAPGKAATQWRIAGAAPAFGSSLDAPRTDGGAAAAARAAATATTSTIGERPADVREVYDPGHPMADAAGIVRYPAVDMVGEMTELMSASRGYEANVRAFNLLRGMLMRALEIGAK